jgi:hypothetical protein
LLLVETLSGPLIRAHDLCPSLWSDADVFAYLRSVGALIARYYEECGEAACRDERAFLAAIPRPTAVWALRRPRDHDDAIARGSSGRCDALPVSTGRCIFLAHTTEAYQMKPDSVAAAEIYTRRIRNTVFGAILLIAWLVLLFRDLFAGLAVGVLAGVLYGLFLLGRWAVRSLKARGARRAARPASHDYAAEIAAETAAENRRGLLGLFALIALASWPEAASSWLGVAVAIDGCYIAVGVFLAVAAWGALAEGEWGSALVTAPIAAWLLIIHPIAGPKRPADQICRTARSRVGPQ